jgi:hypothetical protein
MALSRNSNVYRSETVEKKALFWNPYAFPTRGKFKSWELVEDGNLHISILNMEVECSSEMSVSPQDYRVPIYKITI